MEDKNTLASEVLEMLKGQLKFYKILVAFLVLLLAATNIYHIWQWSQFDTVTVDSGNGYANYVQGDNTGGVYNGAGTELYPLTKRNCAQVTACGIRTRTRYSTCVSTSATGGSFRMLGQPCCAPSNNLSSINGTAPGGAAA